MTTTKLKIIACTAMLLDHLGVYFNFIILHVIGRIAFPIFAYLIVEGFFHTKNIKKYLIRLFAFAIISQIPYVLYFNGPFFDLEPANYSNPILYLQTLNIFFTLFFGLLAIYVFDKNKKMGIVVLVILCIIAQFTNADYGIYGILTIFLFYLFRGHFWKQTISYSTLTILILAKRLIKFALRNYSVFVRCFGIALIAQIFSILALVFIYFYNGKKGKNIKYIFYVFYPGHLLVLWFLRDVLSNINTFLFVG
ncbi:conjugal transfer protein TraX [Vallitalea longa]|uniref:Conjugal transfer protein TraX n=1 Tax=Vallitalea longa TaxID=2936439 RepID=A0A9W6DFC1_9FIRM|nr:TraX family protein [Vallitalea longa]GKX29327.1 conjugal transfer protein TraX [Vallitalea longa]